ncbi:MAG: PIG-L family deacetylase [Cyclobacteriaceae bacterium]
MNKVHRLLFLLLILPTFLSAQAPRRYHPGDIAMGLEKLNVLGNVLYLAAHPDDENTRLITYMANEKKVNTAYFSFTRGDGGQNLVGPEIRELLGLIRTHELLEARKLDNGIQYFSRTNDFGYSKHPDETFNIWDRDQALADLVWFIRKFKPDVIINRFNNVPGETHGHHTASAILGEEAFEAAANPEMFSSQLAYTDIWQTKAMYWNAYIWRASTYQRDTSELLKYDIGKYLPYYGKSVSEIAAESRSLHKSQGFGASGVRGLNYDYLQQIWGEKTSQDIFEHIDISWSRVQGSQQAATFAQQAIDKFDPLQPELTVPTLIKLRKSLNALEDPFWQEIKRKEVDELIYACLGLFLELRINDRTASPGDMVSLTAEMINRSSFPVRVKQIKINPSSTSFNVNKELKNNISNDWKHDLILPDDMPDSHPYWLVNESTPGMYVVDDQEMIGKPENDPAILAHFVLDVGGEEIIYPKAGIFKRTDPVKGEVYSPFYVTPPVHINVTDKVVVFSDTSSRDIQIKVKAGRDEIFGKLTLELPESWTISPAYHDFELQTKGEEAAFWFSIHPPAKSSDINIQATATIGAKEYSKGLTIIDYEHIPYQMLFPETKLRLVRIDLEKKGERIGYVMGAGDDVPTALRQIGYKVDIINDQDFDAELLDTYDAIILGIRALNTIEKLRFDAPKLMEYVKRGGNVIVQYNTNSRLVTEDFAPYTLNISRERVTVEEAPIEMLAENHPILNYPNKITDQDFEGWVQERGLYFANQWADEYTAILSSNDPGEDPLKGGLLVAQYGKGHYIYTGYAWFRQLPAGVPGAYRLFTNMISIGK